MAKVKICGITSVMDAENCALAGADFLGLNFCRESKRRIDLELAQQIAAQVGGRSTLVGVFVDESQEEVLRAANAAGLKWLQFHGSESPEYLRAFSSFTVIKAVRLSSAAALDSALKFSSCSDYLLLDGPHPGSGQRAEENLLQKAFDLGLFSRAFLAGGLSPQNAAALVGRFNPYAIDSASGVEISPGVKDPALVREFISAARVA